MFDDLQRGLERIPEQQTISVDVVLDEDGYYDRTCPASECGNLFKVLFEDWKGLAPDELACCAICREQAEPSEFDSDEQQEHLTAQAKAHLMGQLDDAFRRASPRHEKTGFLEMTLSYQPGARPIIVPAEASPAMTQRSACEVCGCRYASVGAAFFCPACGHDSARTTFAGAIATVRTSMDLVESLPTLIDDRDSADDVGRHIAEDGLVRLWASFQRFAEASYATTAASKAAPARRNAFQNLVESDRLWSGAIAKAYGDFLSMDEQGDLVRLVQARHVLAHQDGIVDSDYVTKSGDQRYAVGQRLVVTASEVRRLAAIVEQLAAGIATALSP